MMNRSRLLFTRSVSRRATNVFHGTSSSGSRWVPTSVVIGNSSSVAAPTYNTVRFQSTSSPGGSSGDPSGQRTWVEWATGNQKSTPATDTTFSSTQPDTSAVADKEFVSPSADNISSSVTDAATTATEVVQSDTMAALEKTAEVVVAADPPGLIAGKIMTGIEHMHIFADIPYWGAIVAVTLIVRIVLLPINIKTVVNSARMAHLKPAMEEVQQRMTMDKMKDDPRMQQKYQKEMQGLFVKHKVNPIRALIFPFLQFPIFISFFWALKDMGLHYDMTQGGMWWFSNLSIADPYYILPVFNSLSFLAMLELGADGMPQEKMGTFKNVMRGLGVAMVPLTASLPSSLFVYWTTNNVFSVCQTVALKQPSLRDKFGIPERPADPVGPPKSMNPFAKISEAIANERSKGLDAKAEILDGRQNVKKDEIDIDTPPPPPPVTFDRRPTPKKR